MQDAKNSGVLRLDTGVMADCWSGHVISILPVVSADSLLSLPFPLQSPIHFPLYYHYYSCVAFCFAITDDNSELSQDVRDAAACVVG